MKPQPTRIATMKECIHAQPVYVPPNERNEVTDIRMGTDGFIFPLCRGAMCVRWEKHEGMTHSAESYGRCTA